MSATIRHDRGALVLLALVILCRLPCPAYGAGGDPDAIAAIDAHTHFYDPSRPQGVPWPSGNDKLLYRTVLPAEFKALTKKYGIAGTIAVEASPWLEDNQWLLDLAAKHPFIRGVVGNLDLSSADFPKQLKRFAANPVFRGLRINHADVRKALEQERLQDHLRLLAKHDRVLDVNGGPDLPADVARLVRLVPELRIVINHAANLPIDGKAVPKNWLTGMRAAAAEKNVYCKVSALVEGTRRARGDVPADVAYYRPVLDALWASFGADRLVYGSNWPVCENAASYATVHGIVDAYFRQHGKAATDKFFRRNAVAAYKLSQEQPADGGRLPKQSPKGRREKLSLGTLFLPEGLNTKRPVPLFVHFHGPAWIAEVAASRHRAAVISVSLGQGSAIYAKPFADPRAFQRLLKEGEQQGDVHFGEVGLTAWSAGYGAVRAILKDKQAYERVGFVILIDGMHASYTNGAAKDVLPAHVEVFVRFAADAAAGKKHMIVTHSQIVPGSYASTTETADYLLQRLGLKRVVLANEGPMKLRQLSEAKKGGFWLTGYAGKEAPDHIDQLHALPEFLMRIPGWATE